MGATPERLEGMKINMKNAEERISAMVCDFPRDGKIVLATEKQYEELVSRIYAESASSFAEALKKQTKKVNRNDYDARISTYTKDFAFFKFVGC